MKTKPVTKTKPVAKSVKPAAVKLKPAVAATVARSPASPPAKAPPQPQAEKSSAPAKVASIKLLVAENPHGKSTKDFAKWAKLSEGMPVAAALSAGVDRGYLNYMASKRKLIAIG